MDTLRKLRWVLYPSVFILVFFVGSYCSFPTSVLRSVAETSLTQAALAFAPPTRGIPKVSIKNVSLWRLSGMDLQDVHITWPGTKKEPPMSIAIDRLKARQGIGAALTKTSNISTDMSLYNGLLSADIKTNKQKSLANLDLNVSKVDLSKIDFISSILGAPVEGILNLIIDMNGNSQLSKDGTGSVNITIDKAVFGPGNLRMPPGSMVPSLSVPQLSLGALNASFTLDKGQLESKTFTLSGGDLEADLKLSVTLGRIPPLSRLNGRGWFSLKKEFINSNETIKMLFDLIPELRAAKSTNGKVGFSLGGTLGRPMPKLEAAPPTASVTNTGSGNTPQKTEESPPK